MKFVGRFQEVNDLLQIRFDAFQAGDVVKRDHLFCRFEFLRGTLAESRKETAAHDVATGATQHHEQKEQDREGEPDKRDHADDVLRVVGVHHRVGHIGLLQFLFEPRDRAHVGGTIEVERLEVLDRFAVLVDLRFLDTVFERRFGFRTRFESSEDTAVTDADRFDVVLFQLLLKEARRDPRPFLALAEEQHRNQPGDHQCDQQRIIVTTVAG